MKTLIAFIFSLGLYTSNFAQDFEPIATAMAEGNASALSSHFDAKVELDLLGDQHQLSKSDAEKELRSFFMSHVAKAYETVHKGSSSNGIQYYIGQLTCETGTFRATVYLKAEGDKLRIQSLEIEEN